MAPINSSTSHRAIVIISLPTHPWALSVFSSTGMKLMQGTGRTGKWGGGVQEKNLEKKSIFQIQWYLLIPWLPVQFNAYWHLRTHRIFSKGVDSAGMWCICKANPIIQTQSGQQVPEEGQCLRCYKFQCLMPPWLQKGYRKGTLWWSHGSISSLVYFFPQDRTREIRKSILFQPKAHQISLNQNDSG